MTGLSMWWRRPVTPTEPLAELERRPDAPTPVGRGLLDARTEPDKRAYPTKVCDAGHWRCGSCYCCPCRSEPCRPGCSNRRCACPDVQYQPRGELMGTSTNAILAYGYNLGSEGDEWEGLAGGLPGWYDSDGEDEVSGAIERRLLAKLLDFTETYQDGRDGFFKREREAEEALGLELVVYCSDSYNMYVLAAHEITVHRGDVKEVTPETLTPDPKWDLQLRRAIEALGIRPKQTKPAWLLCSYWG